MTTNAILSNILVEIFTQKFASLPSPQVVKTIPEVTELSGLGESTPLVRATHFQSTSEEYIGGLADGDEFTITCNSVHQSPDILALVKSYKGLTKYMRVTEKDTSVSPNTSRIYTFDAVVMGWSLAPALADKGSVSFTFKISGGVTETAA
ncbi:hypothetical protein [Litorivivens sp.]|uniref:hypothetical protein n=1 Tax=Litorivivens sp. TaxID=2020868 RepID=UPI0035686E47